MAADNYPAEWRDKIPAEVFACLIPGELRLLLYPGVGLASGGAPYDVPIEKVPFNLRTPNSKVWLRVDEMWKVQKVWQRDDSETVSW